MLQISNLRLELGFTGEDLKRAAAKSLRLPESAIVSVELAKKSVDARKKDRVHFVCAARVRVDADESKLLRRLKDCSVRIAEPYVFELPKGPAPEPLPVVVGFGPGGMFAGLILAQCGQRPIIIELGQPVEERQKSVESFWRSGTLDPESNVQFGEGGAGAFSDGKLTTGTGDGRIRYVLEELAAAGRTGIGWGRSGGEAAATLHERYLAADGIENVIRVLEDMEDEKLRGLDFVELNACSSGCVGGVLNVENPYVAAVRLKRLGRYRPVACNHLEDAIPPDAKWDREVVYAPVMQLDQNPLRAMEMLGRIQEIESRLRGLDCGSCGAPSCHALAEDIVRGYATEDSCIYVLQEKLGAVMTSMMTQGFAQAEPEKEGAL